VGAAKGSTVAVVAFAAALAVGAMTASLRAADPPAPPAPKPVPAATPAPAPTPEQLKQQEQDKRAAAVLNEAKQAYEQKNYGQSVAKYREFVAQFPKRPELTAAQYGLAMGLVEMPDRDWNALIAALQPVIASPDVPDKGRAHYWLAAALRGTGEQQLASMIKPAEQKELLARAQERLGQAAAEYAAADRDLTAAIKDKPAADAKELPPAMELAARAKVEGAQTLNNLAKHKEAAELVKVFAADPVWARSSQKTAALVALGQAQVALRDYPAAFAALAQLAPFDQLGYGLQARYLLGRIHQETGEKPEAVVQYDLVSKEYPAQRRKAEQALQQRDQLRGKPFDQSRLEALVRGVPDYIAMSSLNAGNIQYDYGQFAEAAPRFQSFLQAQPKSEQAPLAQVRLGACYVQAKQPAEAARALQPLVEHPQVGDQATWWMARLQRAVADPANPAHYAKQMTMAAMACGVAADKAAVIGRTDPAAAARRNDILLDQADILVLVKTYKTAAPIYEALANDASNPERAEIAHEKWAMALNRDGQIDASNAACAKFLEKYPRSMLRPMVMFWQAENSYRQGLELAKKPDATTPALAEQIKKLQTQAAAQYQAVVDRYPEFAQASAARFGVGMALYRQQQWEKALTQFQRIADADRVGDLLTASYFQADCLFHTMPENADDALSAARMAGQLEEAAKLLSAFVGSNEERPEMPDAMLKLADCYQRNASILADQQEKTRALQSARETYDKLLAKYPKHPAYASAVMDRARCIAATGDANGAINELNRFRGDAQLVKSDIAPQALIRLSELKVKHGGAIDAAVMLEKARKDYEPELARDPNRAALIPALRYHHGLALKEAGNAKEALAIFQAIIKDFKDRPEAAEASLASIQVRKDEALAKLKAARQAVTAAPVDKPVDATLLATQADAVKGVTEIAAAFAEHADRLAEKSAGSDLHVRTLRDAANSWRAIAETEIDAIKRAKSGESLKKMQERIAKQPQVAGKSNSVPRPPQVRLSSIPLQPAEQKAREFYNKALEAAPESPICAEMRLELAQMHVERGEADPAIQLLSAAIDQNPAPDVLQRLRVQLGNVYLMKKDADGAMRVATQALDDTASPLRPAAYLVKGKALMAQKNWSDAVTVLTRYHAGAEKYVNAGLITQEGLVRLGDAYAELGAWDQSLMAYQTLVSRFGQSRFVAEARFGMGRAYQKLKQFDRAVEAYTDVTRRTSSEVAAKAQLQIGLCRAEQKRWQDAVNELLAVTGTYDYAECAAHASLEAGKALVEMKKPAEAKDVLNGVVRDHPGTEWAQQAEKTLAGIH
jgi:tetratricopeptide (TPR) repeat protein